MSRSGRKNGYNDSTLIEPNSASNRCRSIGIFPIDIKKLLILLAEDEGYNDITITLKSSCPDQCFLENVDPIAVFNNTLVIKESNDGCGKFTYIDICCICTVSYSHISCNSQEQTIKQVRIIGTVAEYSQYESIINIRVTRSSSGHTDNYYVADEYNNLLSGIPLHVDKTYNMAIIPKENPGDVETIDLYGSYKE